VNDSVPDANVSIDQPQLEWHPVAPYIPAPPHYPAVPAHPPLKTLLLAILLFLVTLCTCLVAGAHFAAAYAENEAVNFDEFLNALTLLYKHPFALISGLPFALTLLTILLVHELGHYFACRHHHIHSTYPYFIPFPSLIGTYVAFIMIRSPIRTRRALFDVGASGPLVGFIVAVPALIFGILHAKVVPGLADPNHVSAILGAPLILHGLAALFYPHTPVANILLHPVGRAAWVGLFATSLNLLPAAQLDGGHILRSLSPRLHRYFSIVVPFILIALAYFHFWAGWYVWGALLFIIRFFRFVPIFDPEPLNPARRLGAVISLAVFILCFMPSPFLE
jgi:membrane-associated protease RseP (regulator of RpoE activity)